MEIRGISIIQSEIRKELSKTFRENLPTLGKNKFQKESTQEEGLADSSKVLKNQLLEKLNKVLYSYNKALKIEIDEDLKIPVYKIIDLETKEVIKQIPLEDILKLKKAILEILKREIKNPNDLKGIFIKGEV